MQTLVATIVIGVFIAYFATQNTGPVDIHLAGYTLSQMPVYFVVLISLLLGIFITWLIGLMGQFTTKHTIKKGREENVELTKKIHKMELQNPPLNVDEHAL